MATKIWVNMLTTPSHYLKQCWHFPSVRFCDTHLRSISQWVPVPLFCVMGFKSILLKLLSYIPQVNDVSYDKTQITVGSRIGVPVRATLKINILWEGQRHHVSANSLRLSLTLCQDFSHWSPKFHHHSYISWNMQMDLLWFVCSYMMTSSSCKIFRVTGHLCGEFTGHRWIPRTKASDAELWFFLWSTHE